MNALAAAALSASMYAALAGCNHTPPPPPSTPQAPQATPPPEPELELHRAASASPTGVLVVAGEIVRSCPGLANMKEHPPAADDDSAWLAILQRLADCLDEGDLQGDHVIVAGGAHAVGMVRYVLAKMGVDRNRVEVVDVGAEEACDLDENCSYFAVRVDLVHHVPRQRTF